VVGARHLLSQQLQIWGNTASRLQVVFTLATLGIATWVAHVPMQQGVYV
jgi:hypothetical protein